MGTTRNFGGGGGGGGGGGAGTVRYSCGGDTPVGTVRHSSGGDTQVGETLQWWRHSSGEVVWGQRDTPVVEIPKRGR